MVRFDGELITTWPPERIARAGITIVPQGRRVFGSLTVEETLVLFGAYHDRAVASDRIIERMQLEDKRRAYVGTLSGGQRQRLSIAVALVNDPHIMFLDEPTTGLDPQSRRQIWDIVEGLKARGRTVLITTHYMEEAARLCDRVAVVDHGRVIALGTPRELVREAVRRGLRVLAITDHDDRIGSGEIRNAVFVAGVKILIHPVLVEVLHVGQLGMIQFLHQSLTDHQGDNVITGLDQIVGGTPCRNLGVHFLIA